MFELISYLLSWYLTMSSVNSVWLKCDGSFVNYPFVTSNWHLFEMIGWHYFPLWEKLEGTVSTLQFPQMYTILVVLIVQFKIVY